MDEITKKAIELRNTTKMTLIEIGEELGISGDAVSGRLRRAKDTNSVVREKKEIKEKEIDPELVWGDKEKEESLQANTIIAPWRSGQKVRFAIVSDTHFNSKWTQITHLYNFYDICKAEGINHIYHCGDMDEGDQMRMGHQYECHNQGADDHVDFICKTYPKVDSITTHFITGNHDASIMKRAGYNIGKAIERNRPDMVFLGPDRANVMLTPNCKLALHHPGGGSSYALSYKVQKMIDAIAGGNKPNIMAVGHFHKAEYLFYRGIHTFQAATFQAQTPFMESHSLAAMMGGWIMEIDVLDTGEVASIVPRFIPYYVEIKDDYKNYI